MPLFAESTKDRVQVSNQIVSFPVIEVNTEAYLRVNREQNIPLELANQTMASSNQPVGAFELAHALPSTKTRTEPSLRPFTYSVESRSR